MKRLSEYTEFLKALKLSLIDQFHFSCEPPLKEVLQNPRLVIVINHSTPLSWIPAIACLALEAEKAGGGHRIPRGIVDRWFYSNSFTSWVAEYVSQSSKPQSFEEILQSFHSAENVDLVLFPEGANSFFGNFTEVQEFRSSRFIEIAIRTGSPILMVAHWGSEAWSQSLPLPKELGSLMGSLAPFFGPKISQWGALNLPLIPGKIPKFSMLGQLWAPTLYESDLSDHPQERRAQLDQQAEELRYQMNLLLAEAKKL